MRLSIMPLVPLAMRVVFEGAVDFFRRNRQIADAHADGVCHSVRSSS
jgi:hypothetical protein